MRNVLGQTSIVVQNGGLKEETGVANFSLFYSIDQTNFCHQTNLTPKYAGDVLMLLIAQLSPCQHHRGSNATIVISETKTD